MSDIVSITQVSLDPAYELVARRRITEAKPKFIMVGDKMGMEFLDIFSNLSKPERDLILLLKNRIAYDPIEEEYNPVVRFKPSEELSTSGVTNMSRVLKQLRDKDILRKVKAYHYLINPDFIIPTKYTKYKKLWSSLDKPASE